MNIVLGGIGSLIILVVVFDVLWTTLWAGHGAGPLAGRVTRWLRRAVRSVNPTGNLRLLALSGPILVAGIALTWVALMWSGWVILFSADSAAIARSQDQTLGTLTERVYFTGYTLFTLGNGDIVPQGGAWQIATVLMSASGMFLVTTAVSFFLSVLPAVTAKRALANQITSIAVQSELFVLREWDGSGFPMLGTHLNSIVSSLSTVTEQHNAYPVLHSYHATQRNRASTVAIAVLDDALTILEHGVHPDRRPDSAVLQPARAVVSSYLDTLASGSVATADAPPPAPDLSVLSDSGIPIVAQSEFDLAIQQLADRRRRLLGMIRDEAFEWPTSETTR